MTEYLNVGEYIDQYRILAIQASTPVYALYIVEHTSKSGGPLVLKSWTAQFQTQASYITFNNQVLQLLNFKTSSILPIEDYGVDENDHPYLVLPYEVASLQTLQQRLEYDDVEPITEDLSRKVLAQVGTALVIAHQKGIVHGALSPESILLTGEQDVLVQFAPLITHTATQHGALDPLYQPPEGEATRLSDQYALAGLACELLIDYRTAPSVTPSIEKAITRAQAHNPQQRFRSVREFLQQVGIEISLSEEEAEYEPASTQQTPPSNSYTSQSTWDQIYRTPKPSKQPGKLARPLPYKFLLGSIGLVIAFMVVLHLTGSDWAAGAANASSAALIIGLLLSVVLFVRMWNGMLSSLNTTRWRQGIISVLSIVVLFVYSGLAQSWQGPLHMAQAHSFENQRQWQSAINEYTWGGEGSQNGKDLARVYVSWGFELNKAQHYNEALLKFDTVIAQFSLFPDQVKRAEEGALTARIILAKQFLEAKNYAQATQSLDQILKLPYCDNACHTQVSPLDATAYYQLGERYFQQKDYSRAISAFDTVLSKFAKTPEAKQLHDHMAKSLLGQGQSIRSTSCANAIPTYQRLAKEFSDTNEGKKAKQELNKPQDVKGHFTNVESKIHFTQIGLTHDLFAIMAQGELFSKWYNAIKTDIDGNGNFTFHNVKQGSYELMWYGNDGSNEYVEFIYNQFNLFPTYTADVGPLCPLSLGDVTNKHD